MLTTTKISFLIVLYAFCDKNAAFREKNLQYIKRITKFAPSNQKKESDIVLL